MTWPRAYSPAAHTTGVAHSARGSEGTDAAADHVRDQRRIEREIDDEEERDGGGDAGAEAAERGHHVGQPVEGAAEPDDAGGQAEQDRPALGARRAAERDQQRDERHPAEGWVAEPGERESEERAGERG